MQSTDVFLDSLIDQSSGELKEAIVDIMFCVLLPKAFAGGFTELTTDEVVTAYKATYEGTGISKQFMVASLVIGVEESLRPRPDDDKRLRLLKQELANLSAGELPWELSGLFPAANRADLDRLAKRLGQEVESLDIWVGLRARQYAEWRSVAAEHADQGLFRLWNALNAADKMAHFQAYSERRRQSPGESTQ